MCGRDKIRNREQQVYTEVETEKIQKLQRQIEKAETEKKESNIRV